VSLRAAASGGFALLAGFGAGLVYAGLVYAGLVYAAQVVDLP